MAHHQVLFHTHVEHPCFPLELPATSNSHPFDSSIPMAYQLLNTLNLFQQCVPMRTHGKINLIQHPLGGRIFQITILPDNKRKHAMDLYSLQWFVDTLLKEMQITW